MRRILPFLFLLIYTNCAAQTTIPGGTVTGIWTKAGSPYLIQGNILIANNTQLTIEPGVTVNFQGSYKMLVSGKLTAVGISSDSIRFTAANTGTGWQGIRFENTASSNDSSRIAYCSIKYGYVLNMSGGGIYVNNFSKISITHNSITNCIANEGFGGAIYISGSNAIISNNNLSFNHASAGALCINNGSPLISNNIISYNDNILPFTGDPGGDPDVWGGGISCNYSYATIINNTITNNSSKTYGGGIASIQGSVNISNNVISNNQAENFGGGIFCTSTLSLAGNTISNNISNSSGGGIYFYPASGTASIDKNIIKNNTAAFSGGGLTSYGSSGTITNNLISNNVVSSPGQAYEGGGAIWFVNSNSNTMVANNIICNNSALTNGGAIACYNASPALVNNTLSNNSAANGGALYCLSSSPSLSNMILRGNTALTAGEQIFLSDDISDPSVVYSDIAGGMGPISTNGNFYTGVYQDNIDADALFVAPSAGSGSSFDGTTANWALKNNSPAINAGKPGDTYTATDYAGNLRVVNGIIDMGAVENQTAIPPTATVSGGGVVCAGVPLPPVDFVFTYGTMPFTLQYSINGVPQTPVTGINSLKYTIAHAAAGVYTITSIKDTLSTGTFSGTAIVKIIQANADFTVNDSTQCTAGNNFIFTNTSAISSGSFTSNWNFGDTTVDATIANPSHVYAKSGSYKVRLVISGDGNCTDTVTRTITLVNFNINTLPDTVKTYQDTLTLNAGSGFSSYLWNTGETSQNISVNNNNTGWYKVSVTNNDGCVANDSSYVIFKKNKTLFIDNKQNVCSSSFVDLSVRTKNMTNIIGLQGSIIWSYSEMRLDSIIYNNAAIDFNATDINLSNKFIGRLSYVWNDDSQTGKSVKDSTSIFTLRFTRIAGTSATITPVSFTTAYTPLEIDTINLLSHLPVNTSETAYINGSATFRKAAYSVNEYLSNCDSIVYKNKTYYDTATINDTIKYMGSQCDSVYKKIAITVYSTVTPSVSISSSPISISYGQPVIFNVSANYAGETPKFQWYKNGLVLPGETGLSYSTQTLNAGDSVYVVFKSSLSCAIIDSVISNKLGVDVNYYVSGSIKSPSAVSVRNPSIKVSGYVNGTYSSTTSGNFGYYFSGGQGHNFTLKPVKNNDVNKTNGVSILDIAMIQNHILCTTLFNSPYQWIAADVNKNNKVTSIDILFIKRLILGLDVTFPGNSLWAFVDTSNGALNYSHPLPYKDSILITNLLSDKMNQDFVGVKLGDVNFDWNGNVARPAQPSSSVVTFYYDDVTVKEGNEIRVPVRVRNFKNVLGMQFTLNFNNQSLRFERIENNRLKILCAYNRAEEGKLPFIWSDDKNSLVSLNDDEVLLELVFTERSAFTQEDIGVTSDITNIELWDGNYIRHNIIKGKGKINKKDVPAITGESWEVSPNPTKGTIKVDLYSLKENHISIELLNAEGVVLLKKNLLSGRGINLINLDLRQNQDLPAGVYYLKISGINDVRVKKVLLL